MPSIKAYTQYETLAFCQSVAFHGSETIAFEDISSSLNSNQLIRESETYDQTRLSAAALQSLYRDLLTDEKNAQDSLNVNGDGGSANGTNPLKRKLSTSPAPSDDGPTDDQRLLESLVDKLYARFREQTIKQLKQEEQDYLRLQVEIAQAEEEEIEEQTQESQPEKVNTQDQPTVHASKPIDESPKVSGTQTVSEASNVPIPPNVDAPRTEQISAYPAADGQAPPSLVRSNVPQPLAPSQPPQSPSPALLAGKLSAEPGQPRASHPPPGTAQQSPGAFHRTLPAPSPQRPNYGPINPPHYQPGPQGQPMPLLPQYVGSPHMPPPTEYPPPKRGSASSSQGRGSPVPGQIQQQQQPYPGYTGYPQQPPWPHHPPPPQQYPQPPQFVSQPYYMQSPAGRPPAHYQTPHHPPYVPYPQSAPMQYPGQQLPPPPWPQSQHGQPYYGYHGSANVTPVPRSDARPVISRGRSSTPWKRRAPPQGGVRPVSPTRPDRDVSPISESESPSRQMKSSKAQGKAAQGTEKTQSKLLEAVPPTRGRQRASATPSAFSASRSQSIASFASDTTAGKRRKRDAPHKIKAEPPSTPAEIPSDTEQQPQRTAGRRGRPRASTLASKTGSVTPSASTTNKRKRSVGGGSTSPPRPTAIQGPSSATATATRPQQPPPHRQSSFSLSNDPSLVIVTKNWTKTANLLLNEITSHKLASVFAKPLSERDAPGYKGLVLRPQDLKSIKVASSKGGKAALAAIEAFEERLADGNVGDKETQDEKTPTRAAPNTPKAADPYAGERSLNNGVYLVKVNEDLLPPKGIVNSAQLEMELARMFANAVMFNPLPSSERGFGRSLRLRRRGGDIIPHHQEEVDEEEESSESDESTSSNVGGIISDTREMFEDVMAMVKKWREVELERLGHVGESDLIAAATPLPDPSKPMPQGNMSGNGSINASANPSLRHSESVENEDDAGGPSTPVPSTTGTARKRRRVAAET